MRCPACGNAVPLQAQLCPSCGTSVSGTANLEFNDTSGAAEADLSGATTIAADGPRGPFIVSDSRVENPNVDGILLTPDDFLSMEGRPGVYESEVFFIDVNALPEGMVRSMASWHATNMSFFYTRAPESSELRDLAVSWEGPLIQQGRVREALRTGRFDGVRPASFEEPEVITINGGKASLASLLFVKRWPMAVLVVVGLICGLISTLWWGFTGLFGSEVAFSPIFSAVFRVTDTVTVVCLYALLFIWLVRHVGNTGELLRRYGAGISMANKVTLVARAVASVAFLFIVGAVALYVFLGAGAEQRLPVAMMNNPLTMWLINIVSSLEFMMYVVPMRFVIGIVLPAMFCLALLVVVGGPIAAVLTHAGSIG